MKPRMRRVLAVCFDVLAGFFVYGACVLAFINHPVKWWIVGVFALPALVFLCIGLAISRFRRWRRDVGVVLLSGVGVTASIVFTFACLFMTDEFKDMMQPNSMDFFSAYASGTVFMLIIATLGIRCLKTERKRAEPSTEGDGLKPAP